MTPQQYNRIYELIAQVNEGRAQLEKSEAEITELQLDAARDLMPSHAALKLKVAGLEEELKALSNQHYAELFPDEAKRTHTTPFGGLQFRKSSSLEFENEELVLLKIERVCAAEELSAREQKRQPRFTASALIRTHAAPNLEALSELDDVTLALFGIKREHAENFKVLPFKPATDKPAKKAKAA